MYRSLDDSNRQTRSAERQAAGRSLEEKALRTGPDISELPELAVFGGVEGALVYLHQRWTVYLGAAVDAAMEGTTIEPVGVLRRAWAQVGARHPGLASILSQFANSLAVVRADWRHAELMSAASGCLPEDVPRFAEMRGVGQSHVPRPTGGDCCGRVPRRETCGDPDRLRRRGWSRRRPGSSSPAGWYGGAVPSASRSRPS